MLPLCEAAVGAKLTLEACGDNRCYKSTRTAPSGVSGEAISASVFARPNRKGKADPASTTTSPTDIANGHSKGVHALLVMANLACGMTPAAATALLPCQAIVAKGYLGRSDEDTLAQGEQL